MTISESSVSGLGQGKLILEITKMTISFLKQVHKTFRVLSYT